MRRVDRLSLTRPRVYLSHVNKFSFILISCVVVLFGDFSVVVLDFLCKFFSGSLIGLFVPRGRNAAL